MKFPQRLRREWIIFLLLLPLGVLSMFAVGQAAIRMPPTWRVHADMDSHIDPMLYITAQSAGMIEPLRAEIMTQPVWADTYLTPQAKRTLSPGGTPASPLATVTPTATVTSALPTATSLSTNTPIPTSTVYYPPPPPTNTQKPKPPAPTSTNTPTNTPVPLLSTDLQITKDDGAATYTAGGLTIYTITVSNNGPDDVVAAVITDHIPAQIIAWDWACTTVIKASGCDPVIAGTTDFADAVDIQNGGSITYTVTATTSASASGDLVNMATVAVPTGSADPNLINNTSTDTDTLVKYADLAIYKNDTTDVYSPGNNLSYTVTVTNSGPSNAAGFDISDSVPVEVSGVSVSCSTAGTANCGTNASSGNAIAYTGAAISAGAGNQIILTISGIVTAGTTANIVNMANIIIPGGASFTDPNLANNTASYTHQRLYDLPFGNIGGSKDGSTTNIVSGSSVTLNIPVTVNGNSGWDLVYYELPNGCGIVMDWVILQVGDGSNWYTVLNWGDGLVDTNAIIAPLGLPEADNRSICSTDLYDLTGVALELDGVVPAGIYPYVRIVAPTGDGDGVVEVDAIVPLP
ncbi:MAG: DUF11 domain-containing protein [Anaerolineales bacterium]|nr:DUF11 domain-containing protein [Anaerolineales bacterium]